MATEETLIVHPGDIIQSTRDDWSKGRLFLVEETHRWGVGAVHCYSHAGEEFSVYVRYKPSDFAVVGAAVLLPPEVAQRRRDSLATQRIIAKESGA